MRKSTGYISALLFGAALTLAIPAIGAPTPAKTITDCGANAGDSNDDWRKCEADFIARDKAALHKAEEAVIAAMLKPSQADFRDEEAAWTAYSAKACRFYFTGDWGRDGQVVQGPVCIDGVILARTKELRALAKFLTHYEQ